MSDNPELVITAEGTPNPNAVKFNTNRTLLENGTVDFPDRESAAGSPLAERLFECDAVERVFVGRNFVSVTKKPSSDWSELTGAVEGLKEVLESGGPLVSDSARVLAVESDDPVVQRIREILDNEIRPAVARDGGDIEFYGYQDGVVALHLQGACSHCPSSSMTLKLGVENRLRSMVPEVREVIQV